MNCKKLHITLSLLMLFLVANAQQLQNSSRYRLLPTATEFEAGSEIVLSFSGIYKIRPNLYISNSYGTALISPKYDTAKVSFIIPETFANKIGKIHWKLISNKASLIGHLTIVPKKEVMTLETYVGPPSIQASNNDYSMLVVIPSDALDNPVATNTLVKTNYQFLENEVTTQIPTNNLIAYQNIHAPKKSGRILVSSECLGTNSKEYTIDVLAAIPTNFTINYERPHQYADGNQITTFSTSVIKDANGNIVTDGTYVSFLITTDQGVILKTAGTTVRGIAIAKMIHPDREQKWSVKAHITGMAESNVLAIHYAQVIKDFKVAFSKNNRIVTVGPLQSFMQQMIPDGLQVTLTVYTNGEILKRITQTSRKGYVNFNLKTDAFPNAPYTFKIETAGLEKTYTNKALW